jgi:hypothetical protein
MFTKLLDILDEVPGCVSPKGLNAARRRSTATPLIEHYDAPTFEVKMLQLIPLKTPTWTSM